jgi:CRISPR-associated protein Cas1
MDLPPAAPDETSDAAALPLPMMVAWLHCPRLFHYMHVEGQMVANEHVWRGRHAHARTDAPGQTRVRRAVDVAPSPDAAPDELPPEWREARAVDLGVTDLGVVAKLDAVLLDGEGRAVPAELKSGRGPDLGAPFATWIDGAWNADAIHVALQMMLLGRAGYLVPHGEIYYRATRARVRVALSDALRAEALRVIAEATAAQRAALRPAPLVDSPKCRGCSLVEVCLPDESNLLREGLAPDDGLDDFDDAPPPQPPRLAHGRRLAPLRIQPRTSGPA